MRVGLAHSIVRESAEKSSYERATRDTCEGRGQYARRDKGTDTRDGDNSESGQQAGSATGQRPHRRARAGAGGTIGQGAIVAIAANEAYFGRGEAGQLKFVHGALCLSVVVKQMRYRSCHGI